MVHPRRRRSAAWSMVGVSVFWGMMLGQPCGELPVAPSLANLAPPHPFRLTGHEGALSLHAQDASLKEIIRNRAATAHRDGSQDPAGPTGDTHV
jgi:hypothetical protein